VQQLRRGQSAAPGPARRPLQAGKAQGRKTCCTHHTDGHDGTEAHERGTDENALHGQAAAGASVPAWSLHDTLSSPPESHKSEPTCQRGR
jgi:hypothetical protein